jgi:hypothetical protein
VLQQQHLFHSENGVVQMLEEPGPANFEGPPGQLTPSLTQQVSELNTSKKQDR